MVIKPRRFYLMEKAKQVGLMVVSVIIAVYIYGYATKED